VTEQHAVPPHSLNSVADGQPTQVAALRTTHLPTQQASPEPLSGEQERRPGGYRHDPAGQFRVAGPPQAASYDENHRDQEPPTWAGSAFHAGCGRPVVQPFESAHHREEQHDGDDGGGSENDAKLDQHYGSRRHGHSSR
jgi:hypothetical protein